MAINCLISKGISKVCNTSVAGIQKIWVTNYNEKNSFTATSTDGVDTITLADSAKFYSIEADSNGSYINCNIQQGGNSDSKSFLHQVGFIINRLDQTIVDEYKNWVLGKITVAVLDKNGDVYILGAQNGLTATNFDYQSGTASTDASGITALFEGAEPNALLKVKNLDIVTALV